MKIDGERAYSEQNTGIWWENAEKSISDGAKLLSIILYSDAPNVDTLGKSQLHPIYISIGNINNWRRNKPDYTCHPFKIPSHPNPSQIPNPIPIPIPNTGQTIKNRPADS